MSWLSPVDIAPGARTFADRRDAGRLLSGALARHAGTDPIVLGLPRGGVPVADEVARRLGGTLDTWVVRKLGVPLRPELGMGAIAEGPAVVLDRAIVSALGIPGAEIVDIARHEMGEIRRRIDRLRGGRPPVDPRGRVTILVDDGIATGGTMRAALRAVRKRAPAWLVVAAPVAPPEVVASLEKEADEVVCLLQPSNLYAIGLWYRDFEQVDDAEVRQILDRAREAPPGAPS